MHLLCVCLTQNVIEYCGGAEDRAIIREHEWWFSRDQRHTLPRFHVLLTSYELLNRELTHFRVRTVFLCAFFYLPPFNSAMCRST